VQPLHPCLAATHAPVFILTRRPLQPERPCDIKSQDCSGYKKLLRRCSVEGPTNQIKPGHRHVYPSLLAPPQPVLLGCSLLAWNPGTTSDFLDGGDLISQQHCSVRKKSRSLIGFLPPEAREVVWHRDRPGLNPATTSLRTRLKMNHAVQPVGVNMISPMN